MADVRASLRANGRGIALIALSAVMACLGQLLWKISATAGPGPLLLGFVLYGLGALTMLVAYRYGSLSVLQPMLSLSYVLSLLLGWGVLGERVGGWRVAGVVAIMLGVVLLALGDTAAPRGEADDAR